MPVLDTKTLDSKCNSGSSNCANPKLGNDPRLHEIYDETFSEKDESKFQQRSSTQQPNPENNSFQN